MFGQGFESPQLHNQNTALPFGKGFLLPVFGKYGQKIYPPIISADSLHDFSSR